MSQTEKRLILKKILTYWSTSILFISSIPDFYKMLVAKTGGDDIPVISKLSA